MNEQVEGQLTLFPADSPASRSPLPGSKEARKMTATSGRKWLGLSKNCGPLGLLEKTLLESLEWHSPIFYLSWKPVGIGQGHFLFQLARSKPDTYDTEWQSWPTPTAADSYTDKMKSSQQKEGSRHSVNLSDAVKMYNTPTAQDAKNSTLPQSQIKRDSLVGDVTREMFATPQARDYRTGQASRWEDKEHRSRNLNDQIAMYPTPTTGAGICGGTGNYQQLKKLEEKGVILENERRNMSQGNGGQLNPYWVEWLMGFPPGWTEI